MGHTDQFQEFIDPPIQASSPQAEQMPVKSKKFPAREVVVKVGGLRKKSQPGLCLRIPQIPAEQPCLSARRIDEPHQHLEGRGFPCAVRAEKTEYLPRPYFEFDPIHRSDLLPPEPHTEDL